MARYTLLEVVQAVLNAADDDNVNAIGDTEASDQAALVCKEVYFDLIAEDDWPHLLKLSSLTGLSDVTKPTIVQIPDNVTLLEGDVEEAEQIQYDITTASDDHTVYRDLKYMHPADFLRYIRNRNDSDSNVTKYTGFNSVALLIRTDKMPEYWTSFDDKYIIFDSFHSTTESTIQGSKCTVHVKEIPTWSHTDGAYPNLPDNLFPTYIARCKQKYMAYFTQKTDVIDDKEYTRGKARQRRKGRKTEGRNRRPNYGR